MIIDLGRFVAAEKAYWDELESALARLKDDPERRMTFEEVERLHYLYERCSADLSRLGTFASEPRLRLSLESLVARAYAEIHETRAPIEMRWKEAALAFPRAFRRHWAPSSWPSRPPSWAARSGGSSSARTPARRRCCFPFQA